MKTDTVENSIADVSGYEIFPWSENFATGILLIDEQHKKLVHLLNHLAHHLVHQSDTLTLEAIFSELTDYAIYHFRTEEEIWHEFFSDDELELEHKVTHSQFVTDVQYLKENTNTSEQVIEETLSFLTHWLAFHILDNDKRMAKAVLAMQAGIPIEQAKKQSESEMSGAMKVLVESVLSMYDCLSVRTLQLMKEMVERQKFEAKQRLASNVFENTLDAICIMDVDFNVIDANPAFYQTTGYDVEEVIGKHLKSLKSGLEDNEVASSLWQGLNDNGHCSGKVSSRNKSGEVNAEWLTLSCVKDEQGRISNYVAVFSNISYFIQQQYKLEQIAHHDVLTQLPNRLSLFDRLELAIIHAKNHQRLLAVCYLDLDGFKPINDNFGHDAGDQVLKIVAKRLLDVVRNNDTVARLGGDEFVILFGDIEKVDDCERLLDRVLLEISQPMQLENTLVQVTASIGVTLFPQDDVEPELLLKHADQAMYKAKKSGKSKYCWYR